MKSLIFLAGLLATVSGSILDKRAACNNDNCARAVTGTKAGSSVSSSRVNTDCSSFQRATAYAPAATVMTTSGSVATTITPAMTSTTIIPSGLPAYAQSACASGGNPSSRFGSACSCAGVMKTTTTVTPTVTVVIPTPMNSCNNPYISAAAQYGPNGNDCARGSDGYGCYCLATTDGSNKCVNSGYCSSCATASDCPAGYICGIDADCTSNGGRGCFPLGSCANANTPSMMFKVRAVGPPAI